MTNNDYQRGYRDAINSDPRKPNVSFMYSCGYDAGLVDLNREAVQVEPVAKPMAIVCDCEGTTDDDGRPLHYALLYLDHPLPPGTELFATPQQAAPGWQLVPTEPTAMILSAMATSKARDGEGTFPMLMDLIDFSGENKTHTVLKAAYVAMPAAAPKATP